MGNAPHAGRPAFCKVCDRPPGFATGKNIFDARAGGGYNAFYLHRSFCRRLMLMLQDYQNKILDLLEQLESEMGALYKLFADKFPKYRDLWITMAAQEAQHAAWVAQLHALARDGKVYFDEKLTRTYTVSKVLDIIKEAQSKTRENKITLINALSISRDLEQSILEREFYNYFSGKDAATGSLIRKFKIETIEHQNQLKDAWEKERKTLAGFPGKR